MRPQVIVFDLGRVLLDFDYGIAARQLGTRSSSSVPEIQQTIDQSPLLHQFETGLLSEEQFFAAVQERIGFRGDLGMFRPLFADIFEEIGEMVALHQQLRQNYPTFILSNTNSLAVDHIRGRFDFFSHFTGYIYSYQHQVMKPDPRLYEVVEQTVGARGDAILFVDDRVENVEAAVHRGWQTIWHQTPQLTMEKLRQEALL